MASVSPATPKTECWRQSEVEVLLARRIEMGRFWATNARKQVEVCEFFQIRNQFGESDKRTEARGGNQSGLDQLCFGLSIGRRALDCPLPDAFRID
jgi:hypothetical protein